MNPNFPSMVKMDPIVNLAQFLPHALAQSITSLLLKNTHVFLIRNPNSFFASKYLEEPINSYRDN